jgi:hypothetical protein
VSDVSQLTVKVGLVILHGLGSLNHNLDSFVRVGLEVTFGRIESELILITLVPSELNVRVTVVGKHESDGLSLSNNTVTDVELILSFIG